MNRIKTIFHGVENSAAGIALLFIALLPALEVFIRFFFKTGIHSSTEYVQHLVIWITFVGGMITSREGRHLTLSAGLTLLKEPVRSRVESLTAAVSAGVGACLAWSSLTFVREGFDPTHTIGFFPVQYILYIMPFSFAVITARFIIHAPKGLPSKITAASGIVIAALIGFFLSQYGSVLLWPCAVLLLIAALFGAPIFIVMGGIAFILFFTAGGMAAVIPNEAYTMLTDPSIPALPLFTFAGFILSESKAGERLVNLFRASFGWMPGGLAIATILICTFFTSLTGASGVTILALGGLLSFILLQNRYKHEFTTGLLTVNGIGTLFPPSLPVIMYGVVAHINIKHLFIAGLLPGALMVLALVLYVVSVSIRQRITPIAFKPKEFFVAIKNSVWEILLPFVIVFLYFKGITTLVETSAVTVLYVLLVEFVFYRDFTHKNLQAALLKSLPIMGGVLIILAVAMGLSYYIVDAEIPMQLTAWLQKYIHSKYLFLFLLNIALLVAGGIMDIYGSIIVLVPLLAPLGIAYGIDPVHLGIIFLANMELGYLFPPTGINLLLSSYRFNEPLIRIYRYIVPFLIVMFISVLLITYVPWFSTILLKFIQ